VLESRLPVYSLQLSSFEELVMIANEDLPVC